MKIPQAEIDAINSRVRKRILELPVQYGPKLGEHSERPLKKCPMRKGGVYHLKPQVPYDLYCKLSGDAPTRARAVLALIDRCEHQGRSVTITVTEEPERQGERWLVRFRKGEHPELFDQDIYLARHNDFTMDASRQAVKGDPPYVAPLAEDLRRAREKAREKRISPERIEVMRLRDSADTLARSMASMKVRNRIRLAAKELAKAAEELSVDNSGIFAESVCAVRDAPAAVEGEPPPYGSAPLVPLEPAA